MTQATALEGPLTADELDLINAYWRAANYLSVGQIYLADNPLLREPLRLDYRGATVLTNPPPTAGATTRSCAEVRPSAPAIR